MITRTTTTTHFITAHIDITYHAKDDFSAVFQKEIPPIEGAVDIVSRKYDQKLLEWFFEAYQIYLDIKWLVYRLDLEKRKYKDWERLFSCLLYLIGWSYILIVK